MITARRKASILAGLAAIFWAHHCSAQSAQKVIDEYARAAGGSRNLAKIQTVKFDGNLLEKATGRSGTYTLILKAPGKLYSEITFVPVLADSLGGLAQSTEAYNGISGWRQDSSAPPRTLTGQEAQQLAARATLADSGLLNIKKDKTHAEIVGRETLTGRPVVRLAFHMGPGVRRDILFDETTHLIAKEIGVSGGEDTPGESSRNLKDNAATENSARGAPAINEIGSVEFGDYRRVGALMEPYRMLLDASGRNYEITITHVALDAPVQDSIFDFPGKTDKPLPDIAALLQKVTKNQREIDFIQRKYTCTADEEDDEVDDDANVRKKTTKEYDLFYLGNTQVERLLKKDGRLLTPEEKKKEDDRIDKEYAEYRKKQEQMTPEKQQKEEAKEDKEDQASIAMFLRVSRFTNPRRERFRARDVIVFDFDANPDYKPKGLVEKFLQKLSGVVWIDEEAADVARLEARMNAAMKLGGGLFASLQKGSGFVFEQTYVNNEVWLPTYLEAHFAGRFLLMKGFKENEVTEYSNYRKFEVETKILSGKPPN